MNILALEPYYSGSHRAFLEGWQAHSRHHWTTLQLPGYKWKWRMRHAAITFAKDVQALSNDKRVWDIIFCSDMLNLAEFYGLVDNRIASLPSVVYFHENQLTYPARHQQERDLHFAMTNLATAYTATNVWFNSSYHQQTFLQQMSSFLRHMPDYQPLFTIDNIKEKSVVHYPGITPFSPRPERKPGPLHILWAARWEYDKNPDMFFHAIKLLKESNIDFKLSVLGEQFENTPEIFSQAREYLHEHIIHWGYMQSNSAYRQILQEADVVVSTAIHEFFGISIVEAIAAGAYPVLPKRLAYPELLPDKNHDIFFYDNSIDSLVNKLKYLSIQLKTYNTLWYNTPLLAHQFNNRYQWEKISTELDDALQQVCW